MAQERLWTEERATRRPRFAVLTLLREACELLHLADPSVVSSTTVSRTLDDSDCAPLVEKMATRLAEEYGLDAEVRVEGPVFTVRLSRTGHIHKVRDNGQPSGAGVRAIGVG